MTTQKELAKKWKMIKENSGFKIYHFTLYTILLIRITTSIMGHCYLMNDGNIKKLVMSGNFIDFPS